MRCGNPELVTSQINAARSSPDAAQDAWDRLAALAFDATPAHGGCSAQANECACRAEHAAASEALAELVRPVDPADPATDDCAEPAASASTDSAESTPPAPTTESVA